jgi:hypothetical protein
VNGLRVSDFYTPHYFDSVQSVGVRYSFTGAITKPRQVLRGGYLSWMDPATGFWWQANVFRSSLEITGPNQWKRREGQSWREVVDSHTEEPDRKLRRKAAPSTKRTASQNFASAASGRASAGWAKSLMEDVQILLQA